MKALIQRVTNASIQIDGTDGGHISRGLVVFIGIKKGDTFSCAKWLSEKILNMRIFSDAGGKLHYSVKDISGELLIVSQFTLYGECARGRRPDFAAAETPKKAEALYDMFVEEIRKPGLKVITGKFGSDMQVEIHNDGPVSLIVDSNI